MWLPGRIYKSLPYVYLIVGALFFAGTLYVGFEAAGAKLYAICGLVSVVSGIVVMRLRQLAEKKSPEADAPESA